MSSFDTVLQLNAQRWVESFNRRPVAAPCLVADQLVPFYAVVRVLVSVPA